MRAACYDLAIHITQPVVSANSVEGLKLPIDLDGRITVVPIG